MKLVKALAAIATVAALAGCGATTLEADPVSEVAPVVTAAPAAQVPVTATEDAAITFDIIEAVTVTVAPEVIAPVAAAPAPAVEIAAPVAAAPAVVEIAEVVIPEVAAVPEVAVEVAPAVETTAPAPAPEVVEAQPVPEVTPPTCNQDDSCFVPVTAQDWVREITGITDLIVWEHVGVAWEKGENTCNTLDQVLCRVDFEDGSTSYYIHPDNVGKAGARAAIVEMFS